MKVKEEPSSLVFLSSLLVPLEEEEKDSSAVVLSSLLVVLAVPDPFASVVDLSSFLLPVLLLLLVPRKKSQAQSFGLCIAVPHWKPVSQEPPPSFSTSFVSVAVPPARAFYFVSIELFEALLILYLLVLHLQAFVAHSELLDRPAPSSVVAD